MTGEPIRILLVEDNPGDARLLRELLRESPSLHFLLKHVERLEEARAYLEAEPVDVILLDLSLPDAHGLESVTRTLGFAPGLPIVVLTGLDDEATALGAMQAGAQDYLVKGQVESGVLTRSIRYARERKRLERERALLLDRERDARATAEGAVRARDEVLRVVSHDLGNSLSAVQVIAGVLLRSLPPEGQSQPGIRQKIESVQQLAAQMQRLRQDLLDVTMIEAGRLSIHRDRIAPQVLIESTAERYAPAAAEKSISLVVRAGEDLPYLQADEGRLLQVLANLVGNAIKFTPAGGSITLGAERCEDGVRFDVADTGPGVPAQHLAHVFDRFWTTRMHNPHGAGLGLAISKGIVEAHDGRIWVESEEGAGTTFRFVLPTDEAERELTSP
jgi:signal transduction histidine kinase